MSITITKNIDVDVEVTLDFNDVCEYLDHCSRNEQTDILSYIDEDLIINEVRTQSNIPCPETAKDTKFQKACLKLMEYRHTLPKEIEDMVISFAQKHTV